MAVIRDSSNVRRNLKLNGNYISNDGDNEGISMTDNGSVAITDGTATLSLGGTGATSLSAATTVDLDCTGAMALNSSGGAIGIGNDAVAQAMDIGTGAAARVITIGNATGATAVTIASGTGGIDISTTATTEDAIDITANSVTTGNVFDIGATGLTTGSAIDITSTHSDTGPAINLTSFFTSTSSHQHRGLFFQATKNANTASGDTGDIYGMQINARDTATNVGTARVYGLDINATFSNDNGTTTATGLRVTASGADTNYAAIFDAGRVGIGVTSPYATLEIESDSSAGVPAVLIDNNDTDEIALRIQAANIDADVIDIDANSVTTAKVIDITADGLTSGSMLYLDDDSSSTTARNCVSIIQNNAAALDATALLVQSDAGGTGMKIDKNYPAALVAADTITGLHIDFDHTVPSSGTATQTDIGIDLDVNSATLGASTTYGMDIDVVGAASGTHTLIGLAVDVSGSNDSMYSALFNGGNVGIGVSDPDELLEVAGDVKISGTNNLYFYDTGDEHIAADASGVLTITSGATLDLTAPTVDLNSSTEFNIDTAAYDLNASGAVTLDGATVTIKGTGASKYGDDVATLDFDGDGAVSETGMTSCSITPSGAITLTAGGASTWSTSAGALTVDSAASTLTLDGHTGVTVQSSNSGDILLDSAADIVLDAAGGNFEFKDAGTTQLTIDVDTTAGDIDIQLNVDGDDLVFKQYDGNELMRLADNGNIGIGEVSPAAYLEIKGKFNVALSGTCTGTDGSTTITGSSTAFTSELTNGDAIKVGSNIFSITKITNDTSLRVDSAWPDATASGLSAYKDSDLFGVRNGDDQPQFVVNKNGHTTCNGIAANTIYFQDEIDNTLSAIGTVSIVWSNSQKQNVTVTGTGGALNFTNPSGPCNLLLRIIQADGNDTPGTWDSDIKWAGGSAPTLSTGNGDIDIISFYFDGTSYYGVASLDFS